MKEQGIDYSIITDQIQDLRGPITPGLPDRKIIELGTGEITVLGNSRSYSSELSRYVMKGGEADDMGGFDKTVQNMAVEGISGAIVTRHQMPLAVEVAPLLAKDPEGKSRPLPVTDIVVDISGHVFHQPPYLDKGRNITEAPKQYQNILSDGRVVSIEAARSQVAAD